MQNIPRLVAELYEMYMPRQKEGQSAEHENKTLRGSIDSLIHLVVGMMIAGDLTMEKIEKLGKKLKGTK